MLVKCLLHNIVYYIMNQWLGIMAWHLLPTFYKLYTTNKQKTFKILSHVPLPNPKQRSNHIQMHKYKVKEYK